MEQLLVKSVMGPMHVVVQRTRIMSDVEVAMENLLVEMLLVSQANRTYNAVSFALL